MSRGLVKKIAFPAIGTDGHGLLVYVSCWVDPNDQQPPAAPFQNQFIEVIKRYREINEKIPAARIPHTIFDTDPAEGHVSLIGKSYQLAVVLVDRMARYGTPSENRTIIATGCLSGNEGAVEVVDATDFERKVDLLLSEDGSGSLFIFPKGNSVEEIRPKLDQLRTKRSVELRPVGSLNELAGIVWKNGERRPPTRPIPWPVTFGSPRGMGAGALIALLALSSAYYVVPIIYGSVTEEPWKKVDRSDWNAAQELNTVAAYQTYLQDHPQALHAEEARRAIGTIQMNDRDWATAQGLNTATAYEAYVRDHPQGLRAEDARRMAAAIRKDEADWVAAQKTNSEVAYENYSREHPQGPHAEEARQLAASIRKDKSDWATAQKEGTLMAFEGYMREHPQGLYAEKARQVVAWISKENEDWATAQRLNTIPAYETYLRDNPRGRTDEAKRTIASIRKDDADWTTAQKGNTISNYESYLRDHPQGHYTDEAKRRLETARTAKLLGQADKNCKSDSDVRRQGIADISNTIWRDQAYESLVNDLIACGSLAHAVYVAAKLSNSIWQDQSYIKIANAAIKDRNFDLARDVIGRVSNSIWQDQLRQAYIAATKSSPSQDLDLGAYKEPKFVDYAPSMKFFGADGRPLVWYYKDAQGAIELYDASGFHPRSGEKLLPMTKEIVAELRRIEQQCVTYHNYDGSGKFYGITLDCDYSQPIAKDYSAPIRREGSDLGNKAVCKKLPSGKLLRDAALGCTPTVGNKGVCEILASGKLLCDEGVCEKLASGELLCDTGASYDPAETTGCTTVFKGRNKDGVAIEELGPGCK